MAAAKQGLGGNQTRGPRDDPVPVSFVIPSSGHHSLPGWVIGVPALFHSGTQLDGLAVNHERTVAMMMDGAGMLL